jgi:hypothetical protein
MDFELILIIIWTISGVLTLCQKEVDKFSFALCWIVLMACLIDRFLGVIA